MQYFYDFMKAMQVDLMLKSSFILGLAPHFKGHTFGSSWENISDLLF